MIEQKIMSMIQQKIRFFVENQSFLKFRAFFLVFNDFLGFKHICTEQKLNLVEKSIETGVELLKILKAVE